jgi:pimeloyl-ACP methyl ester carboxylesterase
VVLVSGHVLPYDDERVIAHLSEAEQADLALLRAGPGPELEESYAGIAAATAADPVGALAPMVADWSRPEQAWFARPDIQAVVADELGLAYRQGHRGEFDDGLRTVSALEVDLRSVTVPVRALHGAGDDLEPYANLERLVSMLPDLKIVRFEGMSHFGPWVWPGMITAMIAADN